MAHAKPATKKSAVKNPKVAFVRFTDENYKEQVVNLAYVTGIRPARITRNAYAPTESKHAARELWIVGESGYGTYSVLVTEDEYVKNIQPFLFPENK